MHFYVDQATGQFRKQLAMTIAMNEWSSSVASIPPNLESKSGATFPPVLGWGPKFLTQVFPSILGFSPF